MGLDYSIIKKCASWLEYLNLQPIPHFLKCIDDFEDSLMEQLDLQTEMKHIIKFNLNFFNNKSIKFPDPLFSSQGLLVESFQYGVNIST